MLSNKEIVCPNNLLNVAHKKKGVKAGIVNAGKPLPMLSVQDAVNENLIEPIFIGDEKEIFKCAQDLKWDISEYEIIHEPEENNTAAIAAKLAKDEKIRIPKDIDFKSIGGLSNELVEKLSKIKPDTISQASRISGITPVAILSILRHIKRKVA